MNYERLTQAIKAWEDISDTLVDELADFGTKVELELKNLRHDLAASQGRADEWEQKHDKIEIELDELQTELDEKDAQIRGFRVSLEEAYDKNDACTRRISELEETIASLRFDAEFSDHGQVVKERDAAETDLRNRIHVLEDELEDSFKVDYDPNDPMDVFLVSIINSAVAALESRGSGAVPGVPRVSISNQLGERVQPHDVLLKT